MSSPKSSTRPSGIMVSVSIILSNILLILTPLLHLLTAPFTKVEESFTIQAVHDILVYGVPSSGARLAASYDHFTFPGAVPRSFVGPVLLAGLSQPLIGGVAGFGSAQLVVRAVLGLVNAAPLIVFRRALDRAFGHGTGKLWGYMMVAQFHIMFYLTRTLPNMFAFALTTLASACLLPRTDPSLTAARQKQAIGLLVFAAAIFRSEVAILLITSSLQLLLTRQMTLKTLITVGAGTLFAALAVSVPLDSYFWQKPLWPELWGFYYNVVQGSSSNWGVSPWHYYFTSALPRLLLNPVAIPLMLFALFHPGMSRQARNLALPHLLFVVIYSFQPHKETRFIFYVVPALTGVAALGGRYLLVRWPKNALYKFLTLALVASIFLSAGISFAMLQISAYSYTGGKALASLSGIVRKSGADTALVHADTLTCMTGLTLFGENPGGVPLARVDDPLLQHGVPRPALVFDRTEDEDELLESSFWERFDYVLMEDPRKMTGGVWSLRAVQFGWDGLSWLRPGQHAADVPSPRADQSPTEMFDAAIVWHGESAGMTALREFGRRFTGGWWPGLRFAPRIFVLQAVPVSERDKDGYFWPERELEQSKARAEMEHRS